MLILNTLRTFKKKKFQLAAIGMIIFLSAFIYTTMFYALDSMKLGMEDLMNEGKQEQFSVQMVNGIMPSEVNYMMAHGGANYIGLTLMDIKSVDERLYDALIKRRIKAFDKVYAGYQLEPRTYKDIQFNGQGKANTIRLFKQGEAINLTYIEEGELPTKTDEIALTRVYAQKNGLQIGDTLQIKDKAYTLTGLVLFPDMTLPMLGSDFIIDNSKITVGCVTERSYKRLQGEENVYLAGRAKEEDAMKGFKKKVIDTIKEEGSLDFITQVVLTENQMRSGAIYTELESARAMTLGISMMISSIAVMVVGILTAKILKGEKVQLGVMKAMGYATLEITIPYIVMLLMISLPTLLVGYGAGVMAADPMKMFYLDFYLLPQRPITTRLSVVLTAVGVPLFMTIGLSYMIIKRLLDKNALELLKVGETEKFTVLSKCVFKLLSRAKVQTKYKYSFIFKNTGKFLVFFWGICFATFLIVMSLMMVGFFDKMTVDQYQQVAYQYEGIVDFTKPKPKLKEGDEKYLTIPNAFYKEEIVTLKGLSPEGKLYHLYDVKGNIVTPKLREGVLINRSFEITYGNKVGDVLTITIEERHYELEVVGITNSYGDPTVYGDLQKFSKMMTKDRTSKFFNGVYSERVLEEKQYATVIGKADLMEQMQLMQGFMQIAIYGMIGAAVWISVLILYILTTLTVEDNYYTISLLKVMGYNKREVSRMILNSYLLYAILTYIITLPVVVVSLQALMVYFSRAFDLVMPLEFRAWHAVVGLVMIVIIFLVGSYSAKRKIEKISLQEVLKAYRE
ncbi:MAG: FtsX-like permease family protein [Cellulosilyticaceae bacterium]